MCWFGATASRVTLVQRLGGFSISIKATDVPFFLILVFPHSGLLARSSCVKRVRLRPVVAGEPSSYARVWCIGRRWLASRECRAGRVLMGPRTAPCFG